MVKQTEVLVQYQLNEAKLPFVSHIVFILSKLIDFSVHVSGGCVFICRGSDVMWIAG